MSTERRDTPLLAVALFAVAASVYYYAAGVLCGDRLLSKSSSVALVLFDVAAAVLFARTWYFTSVLHLIVYKQ